MAKYTRGQLAQKARYALDARNSGSDRFTLLVMMISAYTGLKGADIERRIEALAND